MNTSEPLASARPPPKPLAYQSEIQQMMYVFGEVPEAIPQVTSLVEQIVQRHTIEMISNAAAIAKKRGGKTITVDDVVFLVRYDRSRVNRLKDYLGWKDVRKKANTDDKDDMDPLEDDAPDTTMATKKRVKFMWEYVKEFTDHLEDEVNEDDEENLEAFRDMMIRLKADDEATRKMTRAEYMFYSDCKTASFTHRKGKRFRDWAMTDQLGGGKPADDVIDVVGFLCYEMVRQITEMALQVRDQASERTRLVQEALERVLNKGFNPPDKTVPEEVNGHLLPAGLSKSSDAKKEPGGGDKASDESTAPPLRVVPPHQSAMYTGSNAPMPHMMGSFLDHDLHRQHQQYQSASPSPFVNGLSRSLSSSTQPPHPSTNGMPSPALTHSRLGSINETDLTSGGGEPMDVDQPKPDPADRASTPAAPASVKNELAATPQSAADPPAKPLKGKAKKKAEAAAAAAKAAALEKEKAVAATAEKEKEASSASKSSAAGRGTKSTRGRKSKATLAREAKEAAAAAVAKEKEEKDAASAVAAVDQPNESPAPTPKSTPLLANSSSARAGATPEILDALGAAAAAAAQSRPPSEPPTPFRRPATPAAPLPTTSALDHNATSAMATPVRTPLPLYSNQQWRVHGGGGGGSDAYFGGQQSQRILTPLSHLAIPLVLTTNVPMYSLFTEQWRESLPQPVPPSPTESGMEVNAAVPLGCSAAATAGTTDAKAGAGKGAAAASAGDGHAAAPQGPVAPPPPRREPLQAAHIEEAYRRLMTAKCHTRMGRGSTRNAKPRRL